FFLFFFVFGVVIFFLFVGVAVLYCRLVLGVFVVLFRLCLVFLELSSCVRVTVLPHQNLESTHYVIAYYRDGFGAYSFERTVG
ncbi:hypothetical protein, partial [Acinetobacter baumannii]